MRTVSLLIGLALFGLLVLLLLGMLTLLTNWLPAEPISAGIPSSRLIRAADGSMLRLTLARDGQYRLWTPLAQLADATTEAILLKEDRYFYWHPGVNLLSLAPQKFTAAQIAEAWRS